MIDFYIDNITRYIDRLTKNTIDQPELHDMLAIAIANIEYYAYNINVNYNRDYT